MDPEVTATLTLGNLALDRRHDDHSHLDYSVLCQPSGRYEQPYKWESKSTRQTETAVTSAYRSTLRTVIARLDLLGYSLAKARELHESKRLRNSESEDADYKVAHHPPFDAIAESVRLVDVSSYQANGPQLGEGSIWSRASKHLMALLDEDSLAAAARHVLEQNNSSSGKPFSLQMHCEFIIHRLDPFTRLQLLSQNPENLDLPVTWHPFMDVTDEWTERLDIGVGVKREDQFHIVTEGSSDTSIVRRAIELLKPHVADLFSFIDMDQNYPFTGIGNLHNFYQGLLKIDILNNMVIIYDNDAVGITKYDAAAKLPALPNIRILKLPNMPSFESFLTVGPTGEQFANINGQATSIECFLDLHWQTESPPRVRWTSYDKKSGRYQGELEGKESYANRFLALKRAESTTYDVSRLELLLDSIMAECKEMAMARPNEKWLLSFQ
jgi:hypothetical protein